MGYRFAFRAVLVPLGMLALALPGVAGAQLFRAYLSSAGSDANACTLVAPCRLLPAALEAVADGGEIWMLDSANYNTGPVAITKSVSIVAVPGALGSVVGVGGASALLVQAAGTKVSLRNLRVVPIPGVPSTHGIVLSGTTKLSIEGGVIAGFAPGNGVNAFGATELRMTDTIVRDNAVGVNVVDGARATLSRVTLSANTHGARAITATAANGPTRLDIADSTISHNSALGAQAASVVPGGLATVTVRSSLVADHPITGLIATTTTEECRATLSAHNNTLAGNGSGVRADGAGAKAIVASNLVTANATGLEQFNGAAIESAGNVVRDNSVATTGVITSIPLV